MIAIVDYGAGNIFSVKNALDYLGPICGITKSFSSILRTEPLISPNPLHSSNSYPFSKMSCIPRHIPKNGFFSASFLIVDESLAMCSLDLSNRPFLVFNCGFTNQNCGSYDLCMTEEFFRAFSFNAGITMHINLLYGTNDHHKAEAVYKAVAHALKIAASYNTQCLYLQLYDDSRLPNRLLLL